MKTKPLWHDRSVEPVFIEEYAKDKENGRNAYIRIAFLMARPVEPDSDTLVFTIETMRVYREDPYGIVSWEIRSKEEGLVKWCYFDELISDEVQIPDSESPHCGNCEYWNERKSSKDYGQCIEWCITRHKNNGCRQYKRRKEKTENEVQK